MESQMIKNYAMFGLLTAIGLFSVGCGQASNETATESATDTSHADQEVAAHAGWWCAEHGLPEKECSMCSSKAADSFKAKGDWCEEHNRAESQCFICDPSREKKFAALYEAKIGEEPPKPTE